MNSGRSIDLTVEAPVKRLFCARGLLILAETKGRTMSDSTPHTHHSQDAEADAAPPTDAVTDEVHEDAAAAESSLEVAQSPDEPD